MKKLFLLAAALAPASLALADPISIQPNVGSANGVNVGSVTNIGVNNIGAVAQNVGALPGGAVQIDSRAVEQEHMPIVIEEGAFTIGSIVDSGVGGKAAIVTIGSNNVSIRSKSISNVRVETTVNVADDHGVAGAADIEKSFNKITVKDINEN